jgi:GMP synthase PP-ATPase subunit
VFVDTGLLRLNEAEQVMQTFARNLGGCHKLPGRGAPAGV